jgi:hypothetical protein
MIVRDDYQCTGCGEEKSCFVFHEFMLPIALCMECYVRIKAELAEEEPFSGACLLCDTSKDDVRIAKAQSPMLLRGLQMCQDCFAKVSRIIEEGRYL